MVPGTRQCSANVPVVMVMMMVTVLIMVMAVMMLGWREVPKSPCGIRYQVFASPSPKPWADNVGYFN